MATVIGTVTAAGPVVKQRRDQTTYTLNVVEIDGQEYVARKDVCGLATGLVGQRVQAVTRVEHKGQYTNFYLDFIEAAGGGTAPGQAEYVTAAQQAQQATQQVQQQAQPSQQVTTPAQQARDAGVITEAQKQVFFHRQTAAKAAALFSRNPMDFWANVQALVHYFNTGEVPLVGGVTPPQINTPTEQAVQHYQEPSQNQFVPAGYVDPGSELPPPTDDDIPFDLRSS